MKRRILFEAPKTPIYKRIIRAYSFAMRAEGTQVFVIEPPRNRPHEFVKRIHALKPNFVFILDPVCVLWGYDQAARRYLFESIKSTFVFLHLDHIFGPVHDFADLQRRFHALERTKERAIHFCIEESNIADLERLGLPRVYKMFHATELAHVVGKPMFDVCFVGHAQPEPDISHAFSTGTLSTIAEDYRNRLEDFCYALDPRAAQHAEDKCSDGTPSATWLACKQQYRAYLHNLSLAYRGRVLERLAEHHSIDIVGGSPSYIHDRERQGRALRGCRIYPPDYDGAGPIYAQSAISLNITALQFDTALVNRILDVLAAGGFVLTDCRQDVAELGPLHELICASSIDDLAGKIDHYLANPSECRELAQALRHEVAQRFTYERLIRSLFVRLDG